MDAQGSFAGVILAEKQSSRSICAFQVPRFSTKYEYIWTQK